MDDFASSSVPTTLSEGARNHQSVMTDFPDLLFLAPNHHRIGTSTSYNHRQHHQQHRQSPMSGIARDKDHHSSNHSGSSRLRRRTDYVSDVFGAFDNIDNDDLTSARGSGSFARVVHTHHDALAARYRSVDKYNDKEEVEGRPTAATTVAANADTNE
jgi:hypothetical protein